MFEHHSEKYSKEGRGKHASLFDSTADVKSCRGGAVVLYCALHVLVKRSYDATELGWTTDFKEDVEKSIAAHKIKGFGVRSIKARYRGFLCSLHFSCSFRTENIISMVDLWALKPHCDSG